MKGNLVWNIEPYPRLKPWVKSSKVPVRRSEKLQGEGAGQEAKGDAQQLKGDTKNATKDGVNKVADAVNKKL